MAENATAAWYLRFAQNEARGESPVYESWALGVANDPQLLALIDELPRPKRQPVLLFAVSRLLGAPVGDFAPWREWLVEHWPAVRAEALVRSTQTNEPRRCAALLPALGLLAGPLALLEVGASAGLCLYPDRYSYRYDDREPLHPVDGESSVMLECETTGDPPIPAVLPEVVWRAGIDLDPLSVADADDMRWLEALIWPEQHARRRRILDAVAIARRDPPLLVKGDATDALPALAALAPTDATLVISSPGVLVYLSASDRERFVDAALGLVERGAHWVSLEGAGVIPSVQRLLPVPGPEPVGPGLFTLALDGAPLAYVGPHGQRVDWLRP